VPFALGMDFSLFQHDPPVGKTRRKSKIVDGDESHSIDMAS